MLHERRKKIEEILNDKEVVKVSELMELFDVSIETVRRDLEYLEDQGLLKRVYGGAVLPQPKALNRRMRVGRLSILKRRKQLGGRL